MRFTELIFIYVRCIMYSHKDEKFGKIYEEDLDVYFKDNLHLHGHLTKTIDKYNTIDYINDDWVCELKSRRYSIKSFDSFMVGENKMKEAEVSAKKYRFYFCLREGVYYWDFKPNPEDETEDMYYYYGMGGRSDRGRDERKMTAYIFTENLILLTDTIRTP